VREAGFIGQCISVGLFVARAHSLAFPTELKVFQNRTLIGVGIDIQRVERDDGREQRRARTRETTADEISLRHQRAAGATVDRRTNLGEFEIESRRVLVAFATSPPLRLRYKSWPWCQNPLRNGFGRDEFFGALKIILRQLSLTHRPLMLSIRAIVFRLIRPAINREEKVAFLHLLAFFELTLSR